MTTIQAKNAFFFSHDSNARNDEKIVRLRMKHGAKGYGVYFMLVEMLLESSDYMLGADYLGLAFNLHVEEEVVRSVVQDFELFELCPLSDKFYSTSLMKRMEPLENIRELRRQAGIRSGEARREKARKEEENEQQAQPEIEQKRTHVEHMLNTCCQKTNIESREEKSKEEKKRVEQTTHFVLPSVDEVGQYCTQRQNAVDALRFVSFYQSKGWMVGKNKMKDWQASVRAWEQSDKRRQRQKIPNIANHNNEEQYEQF